MRVLSEPGLPQKMLFQGSLSAPGWATASPTQPPSFMLPTPCPSSSFFDVSVGLARVMVSQSPLFSLQDIHVSSPGPPVLLKGRALQVQMASMSPSSAQLCAGQS